MDMQRRVGPSGTTPHGCGLTWRVTGGSVPHSAREEAKLGAARLRVYASQRRSLEQDRARRLDDVWDSEDRPDLVDRGVGGAASKWARAVKYDRATGILNRSCGCVKTAYTARAVLSKP